MTEKASVWREEIQGANASANSELIKFKSQNEITQNDIKYITILIKIFKSLWIL